MPRICFEGEKMKVYIIYMTVFVLLAFLCSTNCPKSSMPNQLPPITQTGANTFGFLLNGQVWLPYSTNIQIQNVLSAQYYQGTIKISAGRVINTQNINQVFNITIYSMKTGTTYYFGATFSDLIQPCTYNNLLNGQLNISRLDTLKDIVSGTFQMTFLGCRDTLKMTNGRFDLTYQ
jgi:hypothetical protein